MPPVVTGYYREGASIFGVSDGNGTTTETHTSPGTSANGTKLGQGKVRPIKTSAGPSRPTRPSAHGNKTTEKRTDYCNTTNRKSTSAIKNPVESVAGTSSSIANGNFRQNSTVSKKTSQFDAKGKVSTNAKDLNTYAPSKINNTPTGSSVIHSTSTKKTTKYYDTRDCRRPVVIQVDDETRLPEGFKVYGKDKELMVQGNGNPGSHCAMTEPSNTHVDTRHAAVGPYQERLLQRQTVGQKEPGTAKTMNQRIQPVVQMAFSHQEMQEIKPTTISPIVRTAIMPLVSVSQEIKSRKHLPTLKSASVPQKLTPKLSTGVPALPKVDAATNPAAERPGVINSSLQLKEDVKICTKSTADVRRENVSGKQLYHDSRTIKKDVVDTFKSHTQDIPVPNGQSQTPTGPLCAKTHDTPMYPSVNSRKIKLSEFDVIDTTSYQKSARTTAARRSTKQVNYIPPASLERASKKCSGKSPAVKKGKEKSTSAKQRNNQLAPIVSKPTGSTHNTTEGTVKKRKGKKAKNGASVASAVPYNPIKARQAILDFITEGQRDDKDIEVPATDSSTSSSDN